MNKSIPDQYAVIFISKFAGEAPEEYRALSEKMTALAKAQPGFLGIESVRNESGEGITVSYWDSLESIKNWKKQEDHLNAQKSGRNDWYRKYEVQICKVERSYKFER